MDVRTDDTNSHDRTTRPSQTNGSVKSSKAKNKEALLTAGLGYGRKKRETLAVFWGTVWPSLEKIGWKRVSDFRETKVFVSFPVLKFKFRMHYFILKSKFQNLISISYRTQ